jgi:hypothetical protein
MGAKDAMAALCYTLLAEQGGVDARRKVEAALRSGEALRCRFLIPTTPAHNGTPDKLSAPNEPEWLAPGSVEEDDRESLFETVDHDTAEILQGMS